MFIYRQKFLRLIKCVAIPKKTFKYLNNIDENYVLTFLFHYNNYDIVQN